MEKATAMIVIPEVRQR